MALVGHSYFYWGKRWMALRHKPGIQKEIKAWIVAFTLSTILTIGLLAIKEMFMKWVFFMRIMRTVNVGNVKNTPASVHVRKSWVL